MITIDAGTKLEDLKNELRWNDAYHRLGGGIGH
jgi:L-arabinose isomerase